MLNFSRLERLYSLQDKSNLIQGNDWSYLKKMIDCVNIKKEKNEPSVVYLWNMCMHYTRRISKLYLIWLTERNAMMSIHQWVIIYSNCIWVTVTIFEWMILTFIRSSYKKMCWFFWHYALINRLNKRDYLNGGCVKDDVNHRVSKAKGFALGGWSIVRHSKKSV